eukprot:SAG31_NODE_589_length_13808_cov_3.896710_11_plen_59_part_00
MSHAVVERYVHGGLTGYFNRDLDSMRQKNCAMNPAAEMRAALEPPWAINWAADERSLA